MKNGLRFLGMALLIIGTATMGWGQGSLTPPGAPAETMKSLQEIWDEVETLKTQVEANQATLSRLADNQGSSTAMLTDMARAQGLTVSNIWQIQTVDNSTEVGQYTSLAFTEAGYPAISYYDDDTNNLKYAEFNGTGWEIETVDSTYLAGHYTSLAFNSAGDPAISYYGNQTLKYAERSGDTWVIVTVDDTADVGIYSSMAFGGTQLPGISYYDRDNEVLKYATRGVSGWALTTVDTNRGAGARSSLAFTPSGQTAISYYDQTHPNYNLMLATTTALQISS